MADYGDPGSYLTLAEGTDVICSDGRPFGTVAHVLAAPEEDIFDGIVIAAPGGYRFVDAPEVGAIHERAVLLKIDHSAAEQLPEPSENPAALSVDPDDRVHVGMGEKLRRAWDGIAGKR